MFPDRRAKQSGRQIPDDLASEAQLSLERELARFRAAVARAQAEINAEVEAVRREADKIQRRVEAEMEAVRRGLVEPLDHPLLADVDDWLSSRARVRARVVFFDGSHSHFFSYDGHLFFKDRLPTNRVAAPEVFTLGQLEDGDLPTPAISVTFAQHRPRRSGSSRSRSGGRWACRRRD